MKALESDGKVCDVRGFITKQRAALSRRQPWRIESLNEPKLPQSEVDFRALIWSLLEKFRRCVARRNLAANKFPRLDRERAEGGSRAENLWLEAGLLEECSPDRRLMIPSSSQIRF